jgi:hypothetical protein
VTQLKDYFKDVMIDRLEKRIAWDYEFATNILENNNPVESLMHTGYLLKTLQLTIIIVNLSYIIGMLFLIFCEAI